METVTKVKPSTDKPGLTNCHCPICDRFIPAEYGYQGTVNQGAIIPCPECNEDFRVEWV